ncbi:MAG: cyclic nucleotide-binding domain-containing protein [Anaerolineales bacterium]|nr:cyclic nucleotide-binding domain-containing protein [Anaerolineales bacterium]
MISPELLKRYPYFGVLSETHLVEIADIAQEIAFLKGTEIFEECGEADTIYLLQDGGVDLHYKYEDEFHPETNKEYPAGEINPGEVFGVSALIEPYSFNATARVSKDCHVIAVDAIALRKLFEKDPTLAYQMMNQTTKILMERLGYLRLQLAAANL